MIVCRVKEEDADTKRGESKLQESESMRKRKREKVRRTRKMKPEYCICKTADDDGNMVLCDDCNVWYHTDCLGISSSQFEKIKSTNLWVCSRCEVSGDESEQESDEEDLKRQKSTTAGRPRKKRRTA